MSQRFVKEKITGEIRLNKYLSDAGVCSRREADRMIEAGQVKVDGITATQGMKITADQQVAVKGQLVEREQEMILLAVNKPRGIVCTTDRRWDDETIYDLVNYPKRIFSIGRLDKDSEGLLLMTNYGDILNKMMRAGNYHEKEYLVTVDKKITPEFLEKMRNGVYLKELDVKTRPCRIELAGEKQFRIILTQGLNRQIRRMCETLRYKVTRLIRVRVMNIELGDLKPGEYRQITRKEFAELMAKLKDSVNNPKYPPKNEDHRKSQKENASRVDHAGSGNGKREMEKAGNMKNKKTRQERNRKSR
ncbi:MAG: pseudouridine synthase [Lachnospiraceae bacterium]|nr:pseudouridine synthase [Lachnospiraceae bacterium]MDD7078061.1 pseudouridine synthase [Lachnospiraceae bacterium]MDY3729578.1 pseudouridine synthase [Candidatus Choladocola sp.]